MLDSLSLAHHFIARPAIWMRPRMLGPRLARVRMSRALMFSVVMSFVLALASVVHADDKAGVVEIATRGGVEVFKVEMAVTDEERAKGLMYRRELPDGQGMLFDFQADREIAMWMKNTFIPLDMIFIRADGTILRIAENTTPQSTAIIASGGAVRAVLEVIGGTARKYGIAPGDKVAHPIFARR